MSLNKEVIDDLHKTGFAGFNLKDLDETLYNKLSNEVGEGPHTLQHNLKLVRTKWLESWDNEIDWEYLYGTAPYRLELFKESDYGDGRRIIEMTIRYDDLNECIGFTDRVYEPEKREFQQLWCFENGLPVPEIRESVFDIFSKVIETFYSKQLDAPNSIYELTWYRKNGIIYSHKDVWDGNLPDPVKLCSILLYLNKNYDKSEQGQLYVDHDKYVVYPEFGNIALIDYNKYALEHRVEPPTSDYGRYGVLSFIDVTKVKNKQSMF